MIKKFIKLQELSVQNCGNEICGDIKMKFIKEYGMYAKLGTEINNFAKLPNWILPSCTNGVWEVTDKIYTNLDTKIAKL